MDERIEAFLLHVLEDEGKHHNVARENARRYLATYVHMFRDQEIDERKKDEAAQRCRDWCRERVVKEIDEREGTETADRLRIVLNAIKEPPPI